MDLCCGVASVEGQREREGGSEGGEPTATGEGQCKAVASRDIDLAPFAFAFPTLSLGWNVGALS